MLGDASILGDVIRERPERIAGEDVRSALRVAHAIPAVLVTRADSVRSAIAAEVEAAFRTHRLDGLVLPASVAPAIERGRPDTTFRRADGSEEAVLWWGYPRPFYLANLTGQPSIVVPMTHESPPLGIQLVGRPFGDAALLDLAEAVERLLAAS
jgi:aspartyl-tRNA(Asn)/glutamyl-tRNA(Gln) amidotransferase subunit A